MRNRSVAPGSASSLCSLLHRPVRPGGDNDYMNAAPAENRLLAALPFVVRQRLLASGEVVELGFAEVLCEPAERIRHVYFPIDGFISLLTPVDGHGNFEVELIGNEGMLGIPLTLGVDVSPVQAVVQGAGSALQISAAAFRRQLESSSGLRRRMNRYIYVSMAQLAQEAACVRFHVLDARLARRLLMTHDRAHSNELHITHEFLAKMLGVRRVGITNAAGLLQERGLVTYSRGDITILDRSGLERVCCKCYWIARNAYERILG